MFLDFKKHNVAEPWTINKNNKLHNPSYVYLFTSQSNKSNDLMKKYGDIVRWVTTEGPQNSKKHTVVHSCSVWKYLIIW